MDMESRADKMILYGPGMKMEEVAIRTKYLMELRDLEIDVEDIDEMERKENFLVDQDPLICFHMIQVSELLPPGSVGGGRTKQWDIPTTPRVNIKVGKVYTNQEIHRASMFFAKAYTELGRIYGSKPDPKAVEEINYQGSFKTDNDNIAHLYISRSDGHFTKAVFKPPDIMGPDEENKRNTTTKSQTCPTPKDGTINTYTSIELKQQPESIVASTLLPSTSSSYAFGVEAITSVGLGDALKEKTSKEVDSTPSILPSYAFGVEGKTPTAPSILPSYAFGVEGKTPTGLGDALIERTNKDIDSIIPLTTLNSRNTTPTATESNMVDQNRETKDTDASGNTAITQKTATELNAIDVEAKDNSRIDNSRVTRTRTNRELINVPATPNPTKGKDTTSIDTTQEFDKEESQQEIRRSTRKRTSPDKFSECGRYNTRKRRTTENETEHDAHNPTSKRKLPMRKHKTGVDLQSCKEMEVSKESSDTCEAQEPLSNKGCNSIDTTKRDNTDNGTVSIVAANGKITKKCAVGTCPGYACDYTACTECERLVHKNDHCSIQCNHPNMHTNGLLLHRVCIECYELKSLNKT
jgi:hypothetical protein